MSETEMKLRDAATQMKLALRNMSDDEIVRSCVNAFISEARSITFVMQRESKDTPLEAWYNERMDVLKEMPLLKFFNASRVYTIHKGVVNPTKHVAPYENLVIDGVPCPGTGVISFLRFEDVDKYIPGNSGGVFNLCEEYFLVLKSLVAEWSAKRRELNTT